ncbi:glucose-1-phosphate cytidylyltransferase [Candidatus Kaiserbacteria bacterium RIFOXYB1_FULL_46_14]|uniref:Glucose-1-phosphate cytidylyltransferase n=1 Tax=Candidatus Kaiserbacteria bacterium RIFOXYB1_FULL_46_14 TaxID=1798531 RepID=A0A1F6FI21_9BACT|nr:MAG: glucose-1-phosphate cytidylyltransferase [Candidatus Kaiserbacteria bacterium RIFOXYB1_FULL_46_14]
MKVVILAGGLGTRLAEETTVKPKPMVEIGGMPILWHIMKIYSHYGFNEFVICLGYKGEVIKEWFKNYHLRQSDVTFDFLTGATKFHSQTREPWKVTLVDTGAQSMTGGRLLRLKELIGNERFMLTYGDGVGNVNISELVKHHEDSGKLATLTSVIPGGRFGVVETDESNSVLAFSEKTDNQKRVNAGFFVFEPQVFNYLKDGDATVLEQDPLKTLAHEGQLLSHPHDGFWHPMDTLSDKNKLEGLWSSGEAPWKLWQ